MNISPVYRKWAKKKYFSSQPESERQEMIEKVARYVEAKNKCLSYRKYCYGYIFYLCLNVVNVVFNIFLSNTFLHGDFLNLGFR